jgi:hypothetical protein
MEDSFLRFLLDAWVRTIITSTDNTVLVIQSFPKAMMFNYILMYGIVPIISISFALAMHLLYTVESWFPRDDDLIYLEKLVKRFAFLDFFATDGGFPPETEYRLRHNYSDFLNRLQYEVNRCLRQIRFYFYNSLGSLQNLLHSLLLATMVFRLADIWFGLCLPVRLICRLLFGETVRQYEDWFAPPSGIPWSSMLINENRVWKAAGWFRTTATVSMTSLTTVLPQLRLMVLFGVIGAVGFFGMCYYIMLERRELSDAWRGHIEEHMEEHELIEELDFGQQKLLRRR